MPALELFPEHSPAATCMLQVYPSIDAVCNKFKAQPVNPELAQQAAAMASQYGTAYQQPAAPPKAAATGYQHDPAYAAGAPQYAAGAYAAGPYANGQYAAHAQPGYAAQPYAAAAANGAAPSNGGLPIYVVLCTGDDELRKLSCLWQGSGTLACSVAAQHII